MNTYVKLDMDAQSLPINSNSRRTEKDSIGELELPADCLYGIQTARALENLSFSGSCLKHYPDFVIALACVKKSCALANHEAGHLSDQQVHAIGAACDRVIAGEHLDQFPVDMLHGGGYIAFNQNMNEVLSNLANISIGAEPGANKPIDPSLVNFSQSTADVCATSARLCIFGRTRPLMEALDLLAEALTAKSKQFESITTLARTCLQDAMPAPLGEMFGAYAALVKRRAASLTERAQSLHQVNLGGTVIGNGSGASERYRHLVLAQLTGVIGRKLQHRDNLYDAAQNTDDLGSLSAELRSLAEGLLKIAKDIRLLSSGPKGGFGEIRLPAVQEGSSFFQGKINPVIPETLMQACMVVIGCDRSVSAAAEQAELNLNVFEAVATKGLLDALDMLTKAISLFTSRCVEGIVADEERCRTLAEFGSPEKPAKLVSE